MSGAGSPGEENRNACNILVRKRKGARQLQLNAWKDLELE
jgi:hypothetical protein